MQLKAFVKCVEGKSQTLAVVYQWFREGFTTADLQEAKLLLEQLQHSQAQI